MVRAGYKAGCRARRGIRTGRGVWGLPRGWQWAWQGRPGAGPAKPTTNKEPQCCPSRHGIPRIAHWTGRLTSNREVAGSSPRLTRFWCCQCFFVFLCKPRRCDGGPPSLHSGVPPRPATGRPNARAASSDNRLRIVYTWQSSVAMGWDSGIIHRHHGHICTRAGPVSVWLRGSPRPQWQ
jgi:hypothetical protein